MSVETDLHAYLRAGQARKSYLNPKGRHAALKTAVFASAFLLICALQSCSQVGTQGNEAPAETGPFFEKLTVFPAGEAGYYCFRIPALVVTAKGTILAFSEARKLTCHDDAEIDLVLKRSFDQGKTWQDLQLLFDYGTDSVNQPGPYLTKKPARWCSSFAGITSESS